MTESRTAFFYGTLMSPEVLYRVIYGTTTPEAWLKTNLQTQPALLYGYRRHRVQNADYPAISALDPETTPSSPESRRVLGTIVTGLTDMDIYRLDIFEGDQYDRKIVNAHSLSSIEDSHAHVEDQESSVKAETYIWKPELISQLDPQEWDFEEFKREKLKYWASPDAAREDYDEVDAAVAQEVPTHDGTGGRGANGSITRQLAELDNGDGKDTEDVLRSAV